jgi:hypothetical protein
MLPANKHKIIIYIIIHVGSKKALESFKVTWTLTLWREIVRLIMIKGQIKFVT